MAAPTIVTDLTTVDTAESAIGWLNQANMNPTTDTDAFVEGTSSVGLAFAAANTRYSMIADLGGSTNITGTHIFVWVKVNFAICASFAEGGVRVVVTNDNTGNTTNYGEWAVGGRDIQWCQEGWRLIVVDTSRPFDFVGAGTPPSNMTSIRRIGVSALSSALQMTGNSLNVDVLRYGTKIAITGGTTGDPITLKELVDSDLDPASGVYGIVTKNKAGVFEINGELRIGAESGSTNTVFSSRNELITFADQPAALNYLKIKSQQGTGTTDVKFGTGVGSGDAKVGVNGSVIDRINVVHGREYSLDFSSSINLVEFFGTTVLRAKDGLTFPNATGHEAISSSFVACGQVDLGQALARKNTFSSHGFIDTGSVSIAVTAAAVDTGSITIDVTASTRTFTRTAGGSGSFLTDGFEVGMVVTFSGFTNANNNGRKRITSVTATTIVVEKGLVMVNETGTADERVRTEFAYTRSSGSFVTDGFIKDMSITPSGFSNSGNNRTRIITNVKATQIFTRELTGITAESAGTRTIRSAGATGDGALLWNESINIKSSSFVGISNSVVTAAAIQHPSAASSPYTYDALTFSGNDYDVNNTSTAIDTGSVTITVAASAGTLTRSSGSFSSDGFTAGMTITSSGFTNPGNNFETKTIDTITGGGTIITVTDNSSLVDETGGGDERVQRNITIQNVNDADPSTFKGQPVAFVTASNLLVRVKDTSSNPVEFAQTAIFLNDGTPLMNEDTDSNGEASESTTKSGGAYIRVRKSLTGFTKYIPFSTTGTISGDFTLDVTLQEDTNA